MQKHAHCSAIPAAVLALGSAISSGCMEAEAAEPEEFSATSVIVEINATDGDVGFHALADADAWKELRIDDPEGKTLFEAKAKGSLMTQGLTENFFESDEPLCAPDPEEPDATVVPLSEFLQRFPAGNYRFTGKTLENEKLEGADALTHHLPAAPVNIAFNGAAVTWAAGTNLGGCHDDALVTKGVIPDPSTVRVIAWEVTVEPAEGAAVAQPRVFTVQLPGQASTTVAVPPEFLNSYLSQGVTTFKVEVGAIEISGNRTFAEAEFELQAP